MADIVELPDNFIGKEDREKLESFGGHTIGRGRATRWHWGRNADGDDHFEIYRGGEDEVLAATLYRKREEDAFYARDADDEILASGGLEHVLALLEEYFARLHGENPDTLA